jgi:hypothetical protein
MIKECALDDLWVFSFMENKEELLSISGLVLIYKTTSYVKRSYSYKYSINCVVKSFKFISSELLEVTTAAAESLAKKPKH